MGLSVEMCGGGWCLAFRIGSLCISVAMCNPIGFFTLKEYQSIVDAEWTILYEKLDKIVQSGAKVVFSKLPIGDVATQYFADRDVFCAGRVPEEDLRRTMKACGGAIQTSINKLTDDVLGRCDLFEEQQIGGER